MNRITLLALIIFQTFWASSQTNSSVEWRHYTTGNTGIMGDYAEGLWIDHQNNPYIAAYSPGWEEGGFSKLLPQTNQWVNYSNLEYPVIGSTNDVGASRISEIIEDENGVLWMASWRGILKFDPETGANSLEFWGADNSLHPGGRTVDMDIAPDGTIWAAVFSVEWGGGGLVQFNPATNDWNYWGYGQTNNNWPSLIGYCEHVAIQDNGDGEYSVWIDGEGWNTMIVYNSSTDLFTLLPQEYVTGEVVSLPGTDCIDAEGNLWALRVTMPGDPFSLDYRQPDGTWITPSQPSSVMSDIWSFKAFGNHEALITGLSSEIFQFNGTNWQSKGIWREGAYTYGLDIDSQGNIWVTGIEGAAKRDITTGQWQRYRITNSSQIDYWVEDISIDASGHVWMTGNGGPGVGGFQQYDGSNWIGYNEYNYGLGFGFPFPTDNTEVIYSRPSTGEIIINPMFNGLYSWNGSEYQSLNYPADRSEGVVEDSENRLWSLGEYYNLSYLNEDINSWTSVDFMGLGYSIEKDPTRPGTIWACSNYQALRTDGSYEFSKVVDNFPELDPQSDALTTVIPTTDGMAWMGSTKGLFLLNSNNDTYEFFNPENSNIPGESITPLAFSPDGKLWFANFGSTTSPDLGLGWYDGTDFGVFTVDNNGLTHAQIKDIEIKEIENGYELWISCLSRGISVLKVTNNPTSVENVPNQQNTFQVSNYPNPFKEQTYIRFTLEQEAFVNVNIFDVNGRLVNKLSEQFFPEGENELQWNGKNAQGAAMSPGIYSCQLVSNGQNKTIRLILQ